MRIRNNPKALDKLEKSKFLIANPTELKGRWAKEFNNNNPICLEIGMGKGDFICGMAQQNPDLNYIGIERFPTIQYKGLRKIEQLKLENVRIINIDAIELETIFKPNELAKVYLNFSDPWPKSRHHKRRLTHSSFLAIYKNLLPEDGEVIFKTDNRDLYEWSVESISQFGMYLSNISVDLHESEFHKSGLNVVTEYERKFSAKGFKINRLIAKYKKENK